MASFFNSYRYLFYSFVLPILFVLAISFMLYSLDDSIQQVFALLAICIFNSWILYIVLKGIGAWQRVYLNRVSELKERLEEVHFPSKDHILRASKYFILYILLFGFFAIVFSFAVVYDALRASTEAGFLNNLFFSLVTITTVGYGDVLPVGVGKFFVGLELVFGLIYQILAISAGTSYLMKENL